jgi:hypothetical protein
LSLVFARNRQAYSVASAPRDPPASMPTPRHRRSTVKPDRVRALELLDGCGAEGCTEAILHAHDFATADIAELVRAGFASVTAERVVAGSRKMEVARVRITGAGQRVLGKIRNQDAST